MRTERERCLEEMTYTWMCPCCRIYQADAERLPCGDCQTCVDNLGWIVAWERSKQMQRELRKKSA